MINVLYISFGIIAEICHYEDLEKAITDAIYWQHKGVIWISEVEVYRGNDLIATLTGREF